MGEKKKKIISFPFLVTRLNNVTLYFNKLCEVDLSVI